MQSSINRVFVYGTLKQGGRANHLMQDKSAFLGWHITPAEYTLKDLGYFPGVELNGKSVVQGEVYQISDDLLDELDYLENYPHMYERKLIDTPYGPAWIYYLSPNSAWHGRPNCIIEDGIWNVKDANVDKPF